MMRYNFLVLYSRAVARSGIKYEELIQYGQRLGLGEAETREVIETWTQQTMHDIFSQAVVNAIIMRSWGEEWKPQ